MRTWWWSITMGAGSFRLLCPAYVWLVVLLGDWGYLLWLVTGYYLLVDDYSLGDPMGKLRLLVDVHHGNLEGQSPTAGDVGWGQKDLDLRRHRLQLWGSQGEAVALPKHQHFWTLRCGNLLLNPGSWFVIFNKVDCNWSCDDVIFFVWWSNSRFTTSRPLRS